MGREGDSTPNNVDTSIVLSPLGFTRSGFYSYGSGLLDYQSSGGRYWSRTPSGEADADRLNFGSTGLYPRYYVPRGYGFTLRCLAR